MMQPKVPPFLPDEVAALAAQAPELPVPAAQEFTDFVSEDTPLVLQSYSLADHGALPCRLPGGARAERWLRGRSTLTRLHNSPCGAACGVRAHRVDALVAQWRAARNV